MSSRLESIRLENSSIQPVLRRSHNVIQAQADSRRQSAASKCCSFLAIIKMHRRSPARETIVEEPRPLAEEPRAQQEREREESAPSHLDPVKQAAIQANPQVYLETARGTLPRKRRESTRSERSRLEREALRPTIHEDPQGYLFKAKGKLKAHEESAPSRNPARSELYVRERLPTLLRDGAMTRSDFDKSCEEDERNLDMKAEELDRLIESLSSGLEGAISRNRSARNLEAQGVFNDIRSQAERKIDTLIEDKMRCLEGDIIEKKEQKRIRAYNSKILETLDSTIHVLNAFKKKR